ncbi:MAG: L-rhamnose mutarotase [Alkalispirochaeta sp.]
MKRTGFAMQLKPGNEQEYRRRHDAIWPELVKELGRAGVRDYVIYLDRRTGTLFAAQKLTEGNTADTLAETEIMQKWWDHMADLMETNPDKSPVVYDLEEMFYLE